MQLHSKEISPISSIMVVMMQNQYTFDEMAIRAERNNYLFSLTSGVIKRRVEESCSHGTASMFLLGTRAYQALSLFAHPEQPSFTYPPEDTVANKTIINIGRLNGDGLLDEGLKAVEVLTPQAPLLLETSAEIIDRYSRSAGDLRVALAGVAFMCHTQVTAENMLFVA